MFVCVAGKNDIGVDVLKYLFHNCNGRYDLGVVCDKAETGENSWQRSVRFFANNHGIKEYQLDEIYKIPNVIFLSLEFDQIVKPTLFLDARLYNVHFSLLPAYKGMYPSVIPILNGEKYVGVTLHRIDSGIDTGAIISQMKFELRAEYTCRDLYLQFIKHGTQLILDNIEDILAGKECAVPQGQEGSTYHSKKYIDFSNITIDLNQTANGIDRQIKAFSFREYQMPTVCGKEIISTRITNIRSKRKPGTVLFANEQGMVLATIDYNIVLYFDRFRELMESCAKGDFNLVREICTVTEHINAVDEHGWTPLIVATYNNHVDIAKFLIMNGANIWAKNNNGTNLLMYAKEAYMLYKDNELLNLLCSMGLSADECDFSGKSLRDYLNNDGKEFEELL